MFATGLSKCLKYATFIEMNEKDHYLSVEEQ